MDIVRVTVELDRPPSLRCRGNTRTCAAPTWVTASLYSSWTPGSKRPQGRQNFIDPAWIPGGGFTDACLRPCTRLVRARDRGTIGVSSYAQRAR